VDTTSRIEINTEVLDDHHEHHASSTINANTEPKENMGTQGTIKTVQSNEESVRNEERSSQGTVNEAVKGAEDAPKESKSLPLIPPLQYHQTLDELVVLIGATTGAQKPVAYTFHQHEFGPLVTHSVLVSFQLGTDKCEVLLKFDAAVIPDATTVDVSDENIVIVFKKVRR
jgi:hypothetical protein